MSWAIVHQARRRCCDPTRLLCLAQNSIFESLQTPSITSTHSYQQYPTYKISFISTSCLSHHQKDFHDARRNYYTTSLKSFQHDTSTIIKNYHTSIGHIHHPPQQNRTSSSSSLLPTSSSPSNNNITSHHHNNNNSSYHTNTTTSTKQTTPTPPTHTPNTTTTNNNNNNPIINDNGWSFSEVFNLPNSLSILRLVSGPVIGLLILDGQWSIAIPTLAIAGITDWMDGYFARRTKQHTVLGTYLDPLADKVLVGSVVASLGIKGALPLPLVGVIVGRDVLLVTGAFIMRAKSLGWQWPGYKEFFRIAPPVNNTTDQSLSLSSSDNDHHSSITTTTASDNNNNKHTTTTTTTPVAPVIKPLFISKINTVLQLSLITSCMTDAWISWPGAEAVWGIGAVTAGTTVWSSIAYYIAYTRGQLGNGR